MEDHPRTCGEKSTWYLALYVFSGSPPHMRGKELAHDGRDVRQGITPAHAGKRCFMLAIVKATEDHPRTCGEKICAISVKCMA